MKIKLFSIFLLLVISVFYSCSNESKPKVESEDISVPPTPTSATEKQAINDTLKQLWVTIGMDVPESVKYDANSQFLYVSNISGQPTEKNGKGFISKLDVKGKMLKRDWATGFDAPKGMGIHNGKLYVTDIDKLKIVDLATGTIINTYPVKGAEFLNDIDISKDGTVYFSDMKTNKVYSLGKSEVYQLLDLSANYESVNGLYVDGNKLLIGTKNKLLSFDYSDTGIETKEYITETGGIDGVEAIGDNKYLISDWEGRIHLISTDDEKKLLLDTTPEEINAADIEYNADKGIMYVPTFFNNTVVAYRVNL